MILFFHILGRTIPTGFHIFQRGRAQMTQKQVEGGPYPTVATLHNKRRFQTSLASA